jgi:hypothetical protein
LEDDWSFVIKVDALIEAAATHVLTEELGRPELARIFSRLEMGDDVTGKLAFAEALSCFEKEDRLFVRELGKIRNKFAHDVHCVGLTLRDYVSRLDQSQFKNFRAAFGPGQDPYPIAGHKVPEADFVRNNPKLCIWLAGMFVLAIAYQRKSMVAVRRALSQAILDRFAEVIPNGEPEKT